MYQYQYTLRFKSLFNLASTSRKISLQRSAPSHYEQLNNYSKTNKHFGNNAHLRPQRNTTKLPSPTQQLCRYNHQPLGSQDSAIGRFFKSYIKPQRSLKPTTQKSHSISQAMYLIGYLPQTTHALAIISYTDISTEHYPESSGWPEDQVL